MTSLHFSVSPVNWSINIYTRSQFGIFALALFRLASGSTTESLLVTMFPCPDKLRKYLFCWWENNVRGNFITVGRAGWNLITIKHLRRLVSWSFVGPKGRLRNSLQPARSERDSSLNQRIKRDRLDLWPGDVKCYTRTNSRACSMRHRAYARTEYDSPWIAYKYSHGLRCYSDPVSSASREVCQRNLLLFFAV